MLDFAGGLVEIASRFGNGRGNGGGYRGDEGGVDLLVDGGGTVSVIFGAIAFFFSLT